jgi:hypothetical protein
MGNRSSPARFQRPAWNQRQGSNYHNNDRDLLGWREKLRKGVSSIHDKDAQLKELKRQYNDLEAEEKDLEALAYLTEIGLRHFRNAEYYEAFMAFDEVEQLNHKFGQKINQWRILYKIGFILEHLGF